MHNNYYENIAVGDLFVLKANKHFMLVQKYRKILKIQKYKIFHTFLSRASVYACGLFDKLAVIHLLIRIYGL